MVSMKIMGSLILGSYLAIVAFAQENCVSDYNTSICYPQRAGCCYNDNGNTCDSSEPTLQADKEKCLKGCTDNTNCTDFLAGTKCDTNTLTTNKVGVCRYTCTNNTNCGGDSFCSTTSMPYLTPGLCYPCTADGGDCETSYPEWCCSGTCNADGTCEGQPSAGVSLFDRTFSPKLLVGFAVLMASAYFL